MLGVCQQATAQEQKDQGTVEVEVRVGSAQRGSALIDRGAVDHLAQGDIVLFRPREGGLFQGTIVELEERAARVELADPSFLPAAGTRGVVQIPRARTAGEPAHAHLRPAPKRETGEAQGAAPAAPVFTNKDEEWEPGDPLLAKVRPVRPEERAVSRYGRVYAIVDGTRNSEDGRTDFLGRVGGSVTYENLFGHGERVHADAEWNHRDVNVPDNADDERGSQLRLDRLSYEWGGTRFEPERYEVGRFLPSGMPEFGVLDGLEWVKRRRDGDLYGTSVGFLPVPDQEFQNDGDFELSGFYRWVLDESEQLSASAGYQKTFHDGAADRDLVVTTFQHLPRAGWTVLGTAWIDLYTAGDDQKGTFMGLTQAYLSTGRRWESGSSLDLVYSHLEFPEIERNEFLTVTDDQLADDHNERLALRSALALTPAARLRTAVGAWTDQDGQGGDVEIGLELADFLAERAFADVSAFGTRGSFEKNIGVRLAAGRYTDDGRWALAYEFAHHRLDGFSSANDDLPQHRLRFSRDLHTSGDWDLAWRIEGVSYDQEYALTLGLYLERSF